MDVPESHYKILSLYLEDMSKFNPIKMKDLIKSHLEDGHTRDEIAEMLNICKSRISQLHKVEPITKEELLEAINILPKSSVAKIAERLNTSKGRVRYALVRHNITYA